MFSLLPPISLASPVVRKGAILTILCAVLAVPLRAAEAPVPPNATVAYVYVSYTPGGSSTNRIRGFTATANGKLTVIPGSPFLANVASMVVNGKYLFGSNLAGVYVASFLIQPHGALHWVHSTNVTLHDPSGCTYPGVLNLDHTGATLYRSQLSGGLCESSHYQSFMIDKPTGKLIYIGKSADIFLFNDPLTVTGNNQFAYGSDCINYKGFPLDTFTGYRRQAGGLLDVINITAPVPATQDPNDFYCRSDTAADPWNHIAVAMTDTNFNDPFDTSHPPKLGTFTVDSSGNLSTSSTWSNMPGTDVGYVLDLQMARTGKLLAVAGTGGLQVFHFNGANPVTHYTGLLTTTPISQVFWDHNNHLYALSKSAGKLYVFTVTPTTATQAMGSPYTIPSPANLIVQPLTDANGDWDHD